MLLTVWMMLPAYGWVSRAGRKKEVTAWLRDGSGARRMVMVMVMEGEDMQLGGEERACWLASYYLLRPWGGWEWLAGWDS